MNIKNLYVFLLPPIIMLLMGAKCPEIEGAFYQEAGGDPITIFKKNCNKFSFNRYAGDFDWKIDFNGKKDCYYREMIKGKYCAEGKILNNGKVVVTITEKEEY